MGRVIFAIPGDFFARTGGAGYDRRVLAELPALGVAAVHLPLPGRFPDAGPEDVALALAAMQRSARPGDLLLIDGLAYGALPAAAIRALPAPIVALCHHPLCLEEGLSLQRAKALRQNEIEALALAQAVVVTSPHTGELLLRDFGVAPGRLFVAPPGTDSAPRVFGAEGGKAPVALLALGSILPRKAYGLLVEALAGLAALDWRLRIVGSAALDPACAAALSRQIAAAGLGGRICLVGELSGLELEEAFSHSDVFVSASLFEGYGMALAEALARGLPIVTTTGGAAAETVPNAAALKVAPGNVLALREALRRILTEDALRRRLADAAWTAGQALPQWQETARIVAAACLHGHEQGKLTG